MTAHLFVAKNLNALVLGKALIKVKLVASPPEEGGRIEWLKSIPKEPYHPFPGLLCGTSAAPVQSVAGEEWFEIAVGVSQTETPEVGLRHVKVVAQHPDRAGTSSRVKELGDPVALDEGLDRDHLKRQSPNTPEHDAALLPGGLIRVVTDKTAIMFLHDQDPPRPVEKSLLHHCGARSLAPEDEDDRAPVTRRTHDRAHQELGLRPYPPIDQPLIVSPVRTRQPSYGRFFGRQFGLASPRRPDDPLGRGLKAPDKPHNLLDIR
ncbi:MAG: hypothetical protein IVW52_17220 [Acidimicrobiales bacterium]|nr:hypothetical protein [Acidimicrobiales bacterium]